MIDLRTYYAGYRLRLKKLEQGWLEIRARHWIKGDHGYFAGSYSTGGGADAKKAVDKAGESGTPTEDEYGTLYPLLYCKETELKVRKPSE